MMNELVQQILDRSGANDGEKALAQEAFNSAPHEGVLAEILPHLELPQHTKADLWEAKHQSAALSDPKTAKLMVLARLPQDVLETAEKYPQTAKLLVSDAGKGKSSSKQPTDSATESFSDLPSLPTGSVHFSDSAGGHHYVAAKHLDKARAVDPNLKVLRSA